MFKQRKNAYSNTLHQVFRSHYARSRRQLLLGYWSYFMWRFREVIVSCRVNRILLRICSKAEGRSIVKAGIQGEGRRHAANLSSIVRVCGSISSSSRLWSDVTVVSWTCCWFTGRVMNPPEIHKSRSICRRGFFSHTHFPLDLCDRFRTSATSTSLVFR